MLNTTSQVVPVGTALWQRLGLLMDIVLHLGAHRTGSTTFQAYLRQNREALETANIGFWGPYRTRNGLFAGLEPKGPVQKGRKNPQVRAEGRVQMRLEQARQSGLDALLISDENMIGSVRSCVREGELYPAIGERMSRYVRAFGGRVTRISLSIRAQDRFWSSALAFIVARGHPVPGKRKIDEIAGSVRSWRDVITDLSCAAPGAEIRVMPYESYYANPKTLMEQSLCLDADLTGDYEWLNKAPELPDLRKILKDRGESASQLPDGNGLWEPFTAEQAAKMREQFADDVFWLAQGADGLATLTEEAKPRDRGQNPHAGITRGHPYDEGKLDKTG